MRLDQFVSYSLDVTKNESKSIIKNKKIIVNEKIVTDSGYQLDIKKDKVFYNNKQLIYEEFIYLILNKPSGYVTSTSDPLNKTVMSLINEYKRYELFPVGRLDIDTTGLLLITNDGQLSHDLLSPNHHAEKVYLVESSSQLSKDDINILSKGILMDGKLTNPIKIEVIDENHYYFTLTDGKYHEVKRLFEFVKNSVVSLKRIRFGTLELGNLELGTYRKLSTEEVEKLKEYSYGKK